MDRTKLKGRLILTAEALSAVPGCFQCQNGVTVGPCCDDAGRDPSGGTDCRDSCYGISVNPHDAGPDSGFAPGFIIPGDAGDGGSDDA